MHRILKFIDLLCCRYRCVLREQVYSYWYAYYSQIRNSTSPVTRIGTTLPTLSIIPAKIAGFAGESVELKCTSYGGYPTGTVYFNLTDGQLLSLTEEEISPIVTSTSGVVELNEQLTNASAYCYNTEYPDHVKQSSLFIVKSMALAGNSTIYIHDIGSDIELDCAEEIETNAELKFHWLGNIVSAYYRHDQQIKVFYSVSREGGAKTLTCQVSMIGDPARRAINITYRLSYQKAMINKFERGTAFISGGGISIVFIFVITGSALFYAILQEIVGKKSRAVRPSIATELNMNPVESIVTNHTVMTGPGRHENRERNTH